MSTTTEATTTKITIGTLRALRLAKLKAWDAYNRPANNRAALGNAYVAAADAYENAARAWARAARPASSYVTATGQYEATLAEEAAVGLGRESWVHITEGSDGTPTLCGYKPAPDKLTIPANTIRFPGKPFCPTCAARWAFRK